MLAVKINDSHCLVIYTTHPSLFGNDRGLAILTEISGTVVHDGTVVIWSAQGVNCARRVFVEIVFVVCGGNKMQYCFQV